MVGHVVVEQLPVVVARVLRPYTGGSPADAILFRPGSVPRAAIRGPGFCGLAVCLGAPTTTPGSELTPPDGSVCDIAVLLRPHTRLATKSDDTLIVLSFQMHRRLFPPHYERYHVHMCDWDCIKLYDLERSSWPGLAPGIRIFASGKYQGRRDLLRRLMPPSRPPTAGSAGSGRIYPPRGRAFLPWWRDHPMWRARRPPPCWFRQSPRAAS
jgi:hypothetical protein